MFMINKKDYRRLQDRAYRAQKRDQSEVCGVLVGSNSRLALEFMKNHSKEPGAFEIKMSDVRELRQKLKRSKKRVLGYFHSHVISEAVPSKKDISDAPINSLMLIYDVCGRTSSLYRVVGTRKRKSVIEKELLC